MIDKSRVTRLTADAMQILADLGLPREQRNERSALTLLTLLGLSGHAGKGRASRADLDWSEATAPLMGITEIMDYMKEQFGQHYAPNTRETIRRFTVHQFVQAGLAIKNPDDPERPINSPNNRYQVAPHALALLRKFATDEWQRSLAHYVAAAGTLKVRYANEREMARIPVELPGGESMKLTPGGQNEVIKQILEEFCSRFAPAAKVVYVGDTGKKFAHFDVALLQSLGVTVEAHGKMPDVVVYTEAKGWLILIEAVTSHGPMNPKRLIELRELFKGCAAGLVFVTAFPDRKTLNRYLGDIAWETEVWVAEDPTHMIHFNGERFLGPYGRGGGD